MTTDEAKKKECCQMIKRYSIDWKYEEFDEKPDGDICLYSDLIRVDYAMRKFINTSSSINTAPKSNFFQSNTEMAKGDKYSVSDMLSDYMVYEHDRERN